MSEAIDKLQKLIFGLKKWQPKIEEALDYAHGTHTFDDIVAMVMTNKVMFFSFDECFTVMEKIDYPQYSTFHCFLAGGNLEAVLGIIPQMRAVGQVLGCKYLSMSGRKGWSKVLESQGWQYVSTAMFVELGDNDGQRWEARDRVEAAQRH